MGRRAISFISYDPYKDQRIDPASSKDLFKNQELPSCIHDAVSRAKKLVKLMPTSDLSKIAANLDRMVSCHHYAFEQLNNSTKNYSQSDESDNLEAFLIHANHDYPAQEWPIIFGALTLSLAGEIINTLWPTPEYIEEIGYYRTILDSADPNYDPYEVTPKLVDHANNFAVEAVRAVARGEFYSAKSNGKQAQKSEVSAKGGKARELRYLPLKYYVASLYDANYQTRTNNDAANFIFNHLNSLDRELPPPEILSKAHQVEVDLCDLKYPAKGTLKNWLSLHRAGKLLPAE